MRFGRCADCMDYKHLPENGRCRSCLSEQTAESDKNVEWMVVCSVPGKTPSVVADGLEKSEAKKRAAGVKFTYAEPK